MLFWSMKRNSKNDNNNVSQWKLEGDYFEECNITRALLAEYIRI
jgi:hypothetical protein